MKDTCEHCRYWSALCIQKKPGKPLTALCINASSPHSGHQTTMGDRCDKHADSYLGAIDEHPSFAARYRLEDVARAAS